MASLVLKAATPTPEPFLVLERTVAEQSRQAQQMLQPLFLLRRRSCGLVAGGPKSEKTL